MKMKSGPMTPIRKEVANQNHIPSLALKGSKFVNMGERKTEEFQFQITQISQLVVGNIL